MTKRTTKTERLAVLIDRLVIAKELQVEQEALAKLYRDNATKAKKAFEDLENEIAQELSGKKEK